MFEKLKKYAPVTGLLAILACGEEDSPGSNGGKFPDFSGARRDRYTCEEFCEAAVKECGRYGLFRGKEKLEKEYGWCLEDCDVEKLNTGLDEPLPNIPKEYGTKRDIIECAIAGDCTYAVVTGLICPD